jgi:hypothetical protein
MTSTPITARIRFSCPGRLMRAATVLLAMLFVLLRPVCDAFAASGDAHAAGSTQEIHAQVSDAAAAGSSKDDVCCSSVDADALTVPAAAPLPADHSGEPIAVLRADLRVPVAGARHVARFARRDPSPPLSYHARSLRRLD